MSRRYSCPLCPQNNFTSSKAVDEHLIRHHVGRMSRKSFEYLLDQGVPPNKIVEWCRRNGVKLKFNVGHALNHQLKLTAFTEVDADSYVIGLEEARQLWKYLRQSRT